MRLVQVKIKPEVEPRVNEIYSEKVLSVLQNTLGCLYASLIKSESHPHEYISMTLWESKEHVDAYVESGVYKKVLQDLQPVLADSSEWKIQLSKDLTLEYAAVTEEPVVESYSIETASSERIALQEKSPMHVRLLSLKIRMEKIPAFKETYKNTIVPALLKVPGCRYAFLSESMKEVNEFISFTIWNSAKDSENYENNGLFQELIEKTKPMMTELFQWKMQLGQNTKSATSEDIRVEHYSVVAGKDF
jgi:quinol monooxygenase YgiN